VWNNVAVWADTDHESMSVHTRGEKTVGQYGGDISQNRGGGDESVMPAARATTRYWTRDEY